MLKIKWTQTFSMIVYNEKGTMVDEKKIHCKCSFGVVKMSAVIFQNLDLYPTVD
jgi:hypothetical protein